MKLTLDLSVVPSSILVSLRDSLQDELAMTRTRLSVVNQQIEVRAKLDPISNQPPQLESAILGRTARVIMDGRAYLKA